MRNIVLKIIKKHKKGISLNEISTLLKDIDEKKIKRTILNLVEKNKIVKQKSLYFLEEQLNLFKVEILKDFSGFLIAKNLKDCSTILIAKKFSKGALVGDIAIAKEVIYKPKKKPVIKRLKEGKIEKIIKESAKPFTGIVLKKQGKMFIKPDDFSKSLFKIRKSEENSVAVYDKVVAKIFKRNRKYEETVCTILKNFNNSKKASNCVDAMLFSQGVSSSFPEEVIKESKKVKNKINKDLKNRLDLTEKIIFTIDGKTAKDLDDAVSVEKFKEYYILGVHIADVSHFVEPFGFIDNEAKKRGTSIYCANKVIPMLPEELSCDLCSLNPNEKKLCFSVFLKIGFDGKLLEYSFKKTIISSKIKGVYEEINDLLEKKEKSEYFKKYEKFIPTINVMVELYRILKEKKKKRNAVEIETKESILKLDENENVVSVEEKKNGVSEEIIEEFMIFSNSAVAEFAKKNKLPFIFRIHPAPKQEKVESLKEILKKLNIPHKNLNKKIKPKNLEDILEKYKKTNLFYILNKNILNCMEKAEYSEKQIGHFGLALKNYSHFTSPIRRYPDLFIHRILSEYIFNKKNIDYIKTKYKKYIKKVAKTSSAAEKKAMLIERTSLDCFKAEFLKGKIGEKFKGRISSIIDRGIFVMLENTIEGFVSLKELHNSFYFENNIKFVSKKLSTSYEIGQEVKVILINLNISLGKIDFKFEN